MLRLRGRNVRVRWHLRGETAVARVGLHLRFVPVRSHVCRGGGLGVALLRDEHGAVTTTRDEEDCDDGLTGHGSSGASKFATPYRGIRPRRVVIVRRKDEGRRKKGPGRKSV